MRVERTYDVPPTRLYEVLTDLGYLTERSRRYGGAAEPTVHHSDGTVVVTTVRQIPMDKVPSTARRYLGEGRLVQIDQWATPRGDGVVTAVLTVDAGRMPLDMAGRHEIRPVATGSVYAVEVDLKVTVPVVGRAMAGAVASQIEQLLTAELAFTESWLSERDV